MPPAPGGGSVRQTTALPHGEPGGVARTCRRAASWRSRSAPETVTRMGRDPLRGARARGQKRPRGRAWPRPIGTRGAPTKAHQAIELEVAAWTIGQTICRGQHLRSPIRSALFFDFVDNSDRPAKLAPVTGAPILVCESGTGRFLSVQLRRQIRMPKYAAAERRAKIQVIDTMQYRSSLSMRCGI